jgi:hypothetical protein
MRLHENVLRLRPELWRLHHDNATSHTSFFTKEFFYQNNKTLVSHPPYFPLFPLLTIKLKEGHFETSEVIKTESHAVLNALREHDLKDAVKKWQKPKLAQVSPKLVLTRWQHQSWQLWMALCIYKATAAASAWVCKFFFQRDIPGIKLSNHVQFHG